MEMEPVRADDIICEPGDSGGAVIDDKGALIGLISGSEPRTGRSRVCKVTSQEYIAKLVRGESVAFASPKDLTAEQAMLSGTYSLRIEDYKTAATYFEHAAKKEGGEFEAILGRCALEK